MSVGHEVPAINATVRIGALYLICHACNAFPAHCEIHDLTRQSFLQATTLRRRVSVYSLPVTPMLMPVRLRLATADAAIARLEATASRWPPHAGMLASGWHDGHSTCKACADFVAVSCVYRPDTECASACRPRCHVLPVQLSALADRVQCASTRRAHVQGALLRPLSDSLVPAPWQGAGFRVTGQTWSGMPSGAK